MDYKIRPEKGGSDGI